jgi:hypothetical protein
MKKMLLRTALVAALAALFVSPASAQQYFQANLDGSQVVAPTTSPAVGFGCFTLNPDSTLDYQVSYVGLLSFETGAHIHGPAPAGVNAGVQFGLGLGTPKVGTVGPLTGPQIDDLMNGLYYVQIHTTLFPGGEIRGQILATGNPCTVATEETTWGTVKKLYE